MGSLYANDITRMGRTYRVIAQADSLGLTLHQVITIASIVEREAVMPEERSTIASVYYNRIAQGMPLQADPTVQYVIQRREGQKRRLLYADYRIEDPYNTYLRAGLPPGPITNPSKTSLAAAVNPEEHDYFFFVARGDGGHVFSRTITEHNRAAARYHALMRQRRAEQAAAGDAEDDGTR